MFKKNESRYYQKARLTIRKLKRLIEFLIYGAFDTSVFLLTRHTKNNLQQAAIVQLELLGDYFIWLPYGKALADHLQNQNNHVILVGNRVWSKVAERHFPGCDIYGIDRHRFVRDWRYRAKTLRMLHRLGICKTYNPSYPRDGIIEDAVVRALGAPAYGFDAVFVDRPGIDRLWSRRYYSHLVKASPNCHQTVQHNTFLQATGIRPMTADTIALGITRKKQSIAPYYVIAPSANRADKIWPVVRFAAIARRLATLCPSWRCVVIGTTRERPLANQLVRALDGNAENLAGQTSVVELTDLISSARLVLGNDSAAAHIAAACGVPSVAVTGGGHYGQFFPYPADTRGGLLPPVTAAHPMDCFGCDWICRYRTGSGRCFPCIEAITENQVWSAVQRALDTARGSPASIDGPQLSIDSDQ